MKTAVASLRRQPRKRYARWTGRSRSPARRGRAEEHERDDVGEDDRQRQDAQKRDRCSGVLTATAQIALRGRKWRVLGRNVGSQKDRLGRAPGMRGPASK